jgi:hypothetical protein
VVAIDGSRCAGQVVSITTRYASENPLYEISRKIQVRASGAKTGSPFLFPIVSLPEIRFLGLGVPKEPRLCVQSISVVADPASLSLPLTLRIEPGWKGTTLCINGFGPAHWTVA